MRREAWRLLALNKPYLGRLILAIIAAVVGILAGLLIPSVVGHLVQDVLIEGDSGALWPLCGVIIGLSVLRGVSNYLRRNLAGVVSVLVETDLRDRLFAHGG